MKPSNKIAKRKLALIAAGIAICLLLFKPKSDSYFKDHAVKLMGNGHMCSGEQVRAPSGVDYILTAAHCGILANGGQILTITEDGRSLMRKIVAEDPTSDLLLLEGLPGLHGLSIAKSIVPGEHVRTYTHGSNHDTYRTDGALLELQRVIAPLHIIESEADEVKCNSMAKTHVEEYDMFFIQLKVCVLDVLESTTSAQIVHGSSGGMVINDSDKLVGVVSAGDGSFGFLVTLVDINHFLRNY